MVNLELRGNQFFGFYSAMQINAPLIYLRIIDNYGDGNTAVLIDLNAAGASSFLNTVIHDNTSRDNLPVLVDTAGGGYILGFNRSPVQLTGIQSAAGAGYNITGGAIGDPCVATITTQ
jgi:hypothetical protein